MLGALGRCSSSYNEMTRFMNNPEKIGKEKTLSKRIQGFFGDNKSRDTVIKTFANSILPWSAFIAERQGASQETLDGIETGINLGKITRDITSFFNLGDGSLVRTADSLYSACRMAWNAVSTQGGVALSSGEVDGTPMSRYNYNHVVLTHTELGLKIAEHAVNMAQNLCLVGAWALARPAGNLRKYFHVKMDAGGQWLANSFGNWMMAVHITGFVHNILCLFGEYFTFYRDDIKDLPFNIKKNEEDYYYSQFRTTVKLIKNSFEITGDFLRMFGSHLPGSSIGLLSLETVVCGIGLYECWHESI